jgi:hypothetical protein
VGEYLWEELESHISKEHGHKKGMTLEMLVYNVLQIEYEMDFSCEMNFN